MKMFNRSLAVAVLLASLAGLSATSYAAATATVAPPTHSVTGCCYVYLMGKWVCAPC